MLDTKSKHSLLQEPYSTLIFRISLFQTIWELDLRNLKAGNVYVITDNDGEISAMGLEFQVGYDFGIANDAGYNLPVTVGLTWTEAEFESEQALKMVKASLVVLRKEMKSHIFLLYRRWNCIFCWQIHPCSDGTYVGDSYASGLNGSTDSLSYNGKYDPRYGEIDSYFVADLSLHYQATDSTKVFATAKNVFDEEYVVVTHRVLARACRSNFSSVESKF